jgi:hypothetical protein
MTAATFGDFLKRVDIQLEEASGITVKSRSSEKRKVS